MEVFGVTNEIRVINNFINCDLYHPDPIKPGPPPTRPTGEKLLIHVSNFRPVKRVLDCIRILAEVRKHTPAHLLMVGDGPDRGPAEHLARELQLSTARIVLGQAESRGTPDSAGARAADAERNGVVRSSGARSHGLRRGAGGDPRRRRTGIDHPRREWLLEAVGDIAAQAARVVTLLTDDALHWKMAKAGRWNAGERFCTDRIIPLYERYYADVMNAAS